MRLLFCPKHENAFNVDIAIETTNIFRKFIFFKTLNWKRKNFIVDLKFKNSFCYVNLIPISLHPKIFGIKNATEKLRKKCDE